MGLNILAAGASGFLGGHLVTALKSRGHEVTRLVRRTANAPGELTWDPYAGVVDPDAVASADVVINLGGSPTAGNPHSKKWAQELRESRVTTTQVLAEAIASADRPPAFLAGNGISYYGDHGSELLTEAADSRGNALLTEVTREWQSAAQPAVDAGARVVFLRTAPVLDSGSEPIKQLLPLFKLGLGARLGNGQQFFPCISLRDWVGAATFCAEHSSIAGPVNLCCPNTPTNAEFTGALADRAGHPARLVAPAFAVKRLAGAMAPEVLGSLNTRPEALLDAGYRFHDSDVRDVIAAGTR